MAEETPAPSVSQGPVSEEVAPARAKEEGGPVHWLRSHGLLVVLVIGFSVGYFLASFLRYQEFYGTNWDLGIAMQALWSNTHGHLLYEAGDYESAGLESFLEVHTTFIAVPISYLYALLPGAATVLALQAAVVASSAIPLYLIGRRAGLSQGWTVAALSVCLFSFAVTSAILYDFHWEAFIPAEFAWTFYLWSTRRYALAVIPAALGVLTLEVFPFLLVGLVLYFAYPWFKRWLRGPSAKDENAEAPLSRILPLVGLLTFAVVSYVVLRLVQHEVIPRLVGTPPLAAGSQLSSSYLQIFAVTATVHSIPVSLVYWLLLFAAFGFLPLLARQSLLILSLPWFWASVFVHPRFSQEFGDQYAFIAVATISIAFVEGFAQVHQSARKSETKSLLPLEWVIIVVPFLIIALLYSTALLAPTAMGENVLFIVAVIVGVILVVMALSRERKSGWSKTVVRQSYTIRSSGDRLSLNRRSKIVFQSPQAPAPPRWVGLTGFRPKAAPVLGGILAVVIVSNLALSPFFPANFYATVFPGYHFSYSGNPAYGDVNQVVSVIPSGAIVVASDDLFPFVADNDHAYSFGAGAAKLSYFPFPATNLPAYVLLSARDWAQVPAFLRAQLFNVSAYGQIMMVYSQEYPGGIYLLEHGYQGPTTVLQAVPFPNTQLLCPSDFSLGASGRLEAANGTQCGSEIISVPASNLSGNGHSIWYGPYATLLPGRYMVTMSIEGGVNPGQPATASFGVLDGSAYGLPSNWYSFNVRSTNISATQWRTVTVWLNLTHAVSGAEFRGYINYSGVPKPSSATGFLDLNYIEIVRVSATP